MKKFKIISYIILLIVLIILALTIYTNASQNTEQDEKEKAISEIQYLDMKLVELFNNMNNVKTRNYQIYTTKIEESGSAQNSGGENKNSNSNTNSDSNSNSNQNSSNEQTQEESTNENYEMKPSGVLTSDKDIDWESSKNEVELIYTSIPTITIDLYSLNVAQEDILNFNKALDDLTISLEEENKQLSLDNLVKIYEYIPKFAQVIMQDTTILETKLNVFKAYSKLDKNDWEGISLDVSEAINIYSPLLTNTEIDINKQASINKGYIMLNELKNVVDTKDISVFLIKYKNLLEEINNL